MSENFKIAGLFAIYTILSVLGMVIVKQWSPLVRVALGTGVGLIKPGMMLLVGALLYMAGFLTWMVILSRSSLVVAYPIAVGLTMAFSTFCAIFWLGETLTLQNAAGVVLVFLGVLLLAIR